MRGSVALVLLAFVTLLAACETAPRRGNGAKFTVLETLRSDTCGPQSGPIDRVVRYDAELDVDRERATWRIPTSGVSAQGSYTGATRTFRFAAESFQQLRPEDRYTGRPACVIRRIDVIEGTIAGELPSLASDGGADAGDASAEASAPTIMAVESITVGPVAGADCTDSIGASDGQYSALPCAQEFAIVGNVAVE